MCDELIYLSNGSHEVDVEFRDLEQSSVEPPNPDHLKVDAAFARVLHLCGAAHYAETAKTEAEKEGKLRWIGETDIEPYVWSKSIVVF